jgi:hypothetical protein
MTTEPALTDALYMSFAAMWVCSCLLFYVATCFAEHICDFNSCPHRTTGRRKK